MKHARSTRIVEKADDSGAISGTVGRSSHDSTPVTHVRARPSGAYITTSSPTTLHQSLARFSHQLGCLYAVSLQGWNDRADHESKRVLKVRFTCTDTTLGPINIPAKTLRQSHHARTSPVLCILLFYSSFLRSLFPYNL